MITHKGGSLSTEDGVILQEWQWMRHGKVAGLPKPLELVLNPTIRIKVVDAANITVRVRGVNTVRARDVWCVCRAIGVPGPVVR